ncbi:hypothetical protein RN001_013413 [Aquatica leii]|uniref:Uncharacterized protein n=1 Tax=Aquatica leii TaxID=1421715 RepID=A0AAN7QD65_9COLE|nr:hypothetical protein RN001_013413 [Aquatica leii]
MGKRRLNYYKSSSRQHSRRAICMTSKNKTKTTVSEGVNIENLQNGYLDKLDHGNKVFDMNDSNLPGLSKRVRYTDPDFEEAVLKWAEEDYSCDEDDDVDDGDFILSEHDSEMYFLLITMASYSKDIKKPLSEKELQQIVNQMVTNSGNSEWSGDEDVVPIVGLSNFWRFPLLIYENGGGAFWYAYVAAMWTIGISMHFLNLCLGQFTSACGVELYSKFGLGFSVISLVVILTGILPIPICIIYQLHHNRNMSCSKRFSKVFDTSKFGPEDPDLQQAWRIFKDEELQKRIDKGDNCCVDFLKALVGK